MRISSSALISALLSCLSSLAAGQSLDAAGQGADSRGPVASKQPQNPYSLQPFYADFPVALEYPNRHGLEYDRTRRQVREHIVANLQGAGRRETWQTATEFFWDGPEEMVEPLIEAMDRHFGDPSMQDMVRNCVEAMGRMANPAFDEALQRALEHNNEGIRRAALGALARSSKPATLARLASMWPRMESRARQAWLDAVRKRLPDEVVPLFRQQMMANLPAAIRDEVLAATLKLPVAQAAEILRGRWHEAVGEFKAIIAGVLHAVGDTAGTTWLREALDGEDMGTLALAVKHCTIGELGDLRDSLLRLSSHPRPGIRFELAKALMLVEGDDAADVYELLSQPDEAWETKSLAVRELTRRGRTEIATALLEDVATATGTRLQMTLSLLGATADPRAVPIFVERFRNAPEGEGRPFLQSLAVLNCEESAKAMVELFRGPERLVDHSGPNGRLTTRNYLPLMLMNVRGSERVIFDAFRDLPKSDWGRCALLMPTVIGRVSDSQDRELEAEAVPMLEEVLFDRELAPQLRVEALNLLTRSYLTIDTVMRIKNCRFDEQPGMRALFTDFLLDYF
ncbi:MAG: HEAT repeat domain-containing protein [Planctomycetes bacterium]|nr:HEAT repeat domain-containing protein [Planctomycetota bacterium]